ncbi:hypothetical protein AAE478_008748 [Parahypoxylon ruwenzoriense]
MFIGFYTTGPEKGHRHTHTVILLHGRGSNCYEFSQEFLASKACKCADHPQSLRSLLPGIRWVFPSSPATELDGAIYNGSQWFDMGTISNPNDTAYIHTDGLKGSTELVLDIIAQEEKLISHEKIFLGGFGQGFVPAYMAYFLKGKRFTGLIGLCTWLPSDAFGEIKWNLEAVRNIERQERSATPMFIAHTYDEDVFRVDEGRKVRDTLTQKTRGAVEWHEYEHSRHSIGNDDIYDFINREIFTTPRRGNVR